MGQDFPPKAMVTSTVVSQAKEKTGCQEETVHEEIEHTESIVASEFTAQRLGVGDLGINR